jgi:uncharacterized protein
MSQEQLTLKQFVPSSVCLKCDGCCRFQTPDSLWRPKGEDADYIATVADCGKHLCRFLNKTDSTCTVYANRPFECALYPFLLSHGSDGIDVFVHLACPYVQQNEQDPKLQEHVGYLQDLFRQPQMADFLRRNPQVVGDYSSVHIEMRHLFTLPKLFA